MKILGVSANVEKKKAREAVRLVCEKAAGAGFRVIVDRASSSIAPEGIEVSDDVFSRADFIAALGGDGTMLRVTRDLDGADMPVLGINTGSLGFLTSIGVDEVPEALHALAEGRYRISPRALLECSVTKGGSSGGIYRALNDVVITNASPSRVVTLHVAVGDDKGTSFVGDGLIVCTPSGSTGHSLSSGGPIVHPGVKGMIMSLICPQTLSSRPMVVPEQDGIMITVHSSSAKVMLTMDGQVSMALGTGDMVKVKTSDKTAKFVQMEDYSYFSVLRRKLHWSLSNARDAAS